MTTTETKTETKRFMSPLAWVLFLSGGFFVIFLVISGMVYLTRSPAVIKSGGTTSIFGGDAVGIIEISGPIMDSKKTLARLERFESNDQVKAVVLRLNSPGGAVAPSQEIYEAVKAYKKPVVVSMSSVAASGAYYIACGAKKIFANSGSMTGSIGVILEFANLGRLYEWAKVNRFVVKTGKFKDMGSESRPMTEEEKEVFQAMIDDVLSQFKKAVMTGRNLTKEQVNAVADGRIFSGSQAKAVHLVDELGTLSDAVNAAGKLGGIKGKPVVLVSNKPKRSIVDLLTDDGGDGADSKAWSGGQSTGVERLLRLFLESEEKVFSPGLYSIWPGVRFQ